MSTPRSSLKITIKLPTASGPASALDKSATPTTDQSPAPEQKKRKRSGDEDDGGDDKPTPSKRAARETEVDGKRKPKKRVVPPDWTPSPPAGGKGADKSKRKSTYDEDEDFDPERVSSPVIDVEELGEEERPKKKLAPSAPAAANSSRSKRVRKPTAKAAVLMSDEEDDYDTPPPTPPRNGKSTKSKSRTSTANGTIVARDQRRLPGDSQVKAESSSAAVVVGSGVPVAAARPALPMPALKPKLPPIKKKSMLPGTPGSNGSTLPTVKDDNKVTASTSREAGTRNTDVYNLLFSGGKMSKDREKQDTRRQELDAMRDEARKKRDNEAKHTFDMLAHSAAMNRFEGRLRERRNWPSPSQIGSVFLMLKRYRNDL